MSIRCDLRPAAAHSVQVAWSGRRPARCCDAVRGLVGDRPAGARAWIHGGLHGRGHSDCPSGRFARAQRDSVARLARSTARAPRFGLY